MRTRILLPLLMVAAAAKAAAGDSLGPVGMDAYSQEILIRFRSEADAARAKLAIAPLYHDLRAAFSTRMDDSTLNDLVVPKVAERYGQKATFYLNNLYSWYQDSPETGVARPKDPAKEIPPILLAGGNSLGGHTLSHEYLPSLTKNDAFREIMGIRVALESQTGSPVCCFAYPFIAYREGTLRNGQDRSDLEAMLRRSGYYQLAEHRYNADWDSGLQDALFVTLDGSDGGGAYSEAALTQDYDAADRPLFLVTMHAWVGNWGAPDFPRLAALYAKWSGRRDWWYCNQNAYAAYRYQARHARLLDSQDGRTVRAVLVRPDPRDLDDPIPLTLRVTGVPRDSILSVECPSALAQSVDLGDAYAFDLSHDRDRGPVAAFGATDNPSDKAEMEGAETGPEGLRARLQRQASTLHLILRNEAGRPLRDLRVVFRLPLRWREDAIRRLIPSIGAGETATVEAALDEREAPEAYRQGPEYDVAQIDYAGAERDRLYATCESAGPELPGYFAQDGFLILGPLAGDEASFDPLAFAGPILAGAPPQRTYDVHWSGRLSWKVFDAARAGILDPDIIPTTGKAAIPKFYVGDASIYFPHANAQYLLYGHLVAPREMAVRAVFRHDCVRKLTVNGTEVTGDRLDLKPGANDVRLLYAPASRAGTTFAATNYGCYFRITDDQGGRLKDVRFERPALP